MLTKIKSNLQEYEVGKSGVTEILQTDHGTEKTIIYKVTFENGSFTFVGMLVEEHDAT